MPITSLTRNIILITIIAVLIFFGGWALLHTVALNMRNKVADGLLADFVVTFPVLYYLIIIRPSQTSAKRLLFIISICSIIAYLILPAQQKAYILQIRKLSAFAELLFVIYAFTKFNKLWLAYKYQKALLPDPIYNLRLAMASTMGHSLGVKVIASELAVLRYGLLSWKKEKPALTQSRSFSTHKDFGYIAIWCILFVAIMVETFAFHLLLLKWSPLAAMIVTGLTLYGVIFLVADLSAVIKRRVEINQTTLLLRTGLRWRAIVDIANICTINKIVNDYHSNNFYFKGGIIKSSGNLLITFKTPVQVDKLYGKSKMTNTILMNIDNYEAFAAMVNNAVKLLS
ncbi:hypothetical protein [Mucilaginibacter ginsenosidivorax]|uniref:PH domain-containing protein n=1 Tax=Mucilaginibacter ginsenosidivorax TaxID=862126 RepID=A0A5B8W0K2_9SPHI|nr:hypothetical protein [Mucilaginibacter ginsenosidivorax]QEC75738.1 hypothetical protein FSB76_07150 [Mucilaginibacter ginsenosidivorax]